MCGTTCPGHSGGDGADIAQPELDPEAFGRKTQLALSSFFGWPAATRLVQDKVLESYDKCLKVNRNVVRAAACKKRMRMVKTAKEDAVRLHNVVA